MRMFVAAAMIGTAIVTVSASQPSRRHASDVVERPFRAKGRITMDLTAGEYRIVGGAENRIRVAWTAKDSRQYWKINVRADVHGADAAITTDGPLNNNFRATIDVPTQADLYVRLSAGELRLERVEGDKDIALHAGEVDIDVGNARDYRRVEASVWAGELHVEPFGRAKEGLFRSFDWSGNGRYRLNAHLKAGELRMHATR
jgi:hypothetical protein